MRATRKEVGGVQRKTKEGSRHIGSTLDIGEAGVIEGTASGVQAASMGNRACQSIGRCRQVCCSSRLDGFAGPVSRNFAPHPSPNCSTYMSCLSTVW